MDTNQAVETIHYVADKQRRALALLQEWEKENSELEPEIVDNWPNGQVSENTRFLFFE